MDLYICEKPSQAKDLGGVLNVTGRGDGYLHNSGNTKITWAIGHLLESYMPDDYDAAFKSWSVDTLPIVPVTWKKKKKYKTKKQLTVISRLLKEATTVYIATDFDREGELIARELLDLYRYNGAIKRVCLTSLDQDSIQKALRNIKADHETVNYYHAGLARERADWLVGMNFSRLYTVLARSVGFQETLHIGRVITPTVAIVCERDREIQNFQKSPYYELYAQISVQNGSFIGKWVPIDEVADSEGRCIHKPYIDQVAQQLPGKHGQITHAETKESKESAPLPFDLTSLQIYAAKKWDYTAQQVLDAAQTLYESYKATSYPRTDSRYLPLSQYEEVPDVVQTLMLNDPEFVSLCSGADPQKKGRVFNDKKVTAHHAIIPTKQRFDLTKLNEIEFNLYDVIRKHYIAQFYAPFEFLKTNITTTIGDHNFLTQGKTPTAQGWKVIFHNEPQENENPDELEQSSLPPVHQGEPAVFESAEVKDKMTRPPAHFTEATLLGAMEHVARFVDDPNLKKILKDTSGLGTPATRANILEGAIKKSYLKRSKKTLRATEKAFSLIDIIPPILSSAGMTAAWEQQLDMIESGELRMQDFEAQLKNWVQEMVEFVKSNSGSLLQSAGGLKAPEANCLACHSKMQLINGKKGKFWACQNKSDCGKTFPDKNGKPQAPKPKIEGPACPKCGGKTYQRQSKKKKSSTFFGCGDFPKCDGVIFPN